VKSCRPLTIQEVTERWSALASGLLRRRNMNAAERYEKAKYLAMQSIQFQELVHAWEQVLLAQEKMDEERRKERGKYKTVTTDDGEVLQVQEETIAPPPPLPDQATIDKMTELP
jgi:hypothetical protein